MVSPKRIALAMTGASGGLYFLRLLARLLMRDDVEGHLMISEGGRRVLWEESGLKWADMDTGHFALHANKDIGASVASGSNPLDALVVVPCSMNTLGSMAWGISNNLILRTAAVQMKENRCIILVPRETPLSLVHLRAMVALREAGTMILPAMPGFYHQPKSIEDLVDTVVDRILDHLGLADSAIKRWEP